MLHAVYIECSLISEVLIPLENETVTLREEGHFFCQVLGNSPILRIDGKRKNIPFRIPRDINITIDNGTTIGSLTVTNISIVIIATEKWNNTEFECYDMKMDRSEASRATLTVLGML